MARRIENVEVKALLLRLEQQVLDMTRILEETKCTIQLVKNLPEQGAVSEAAKLVIKPKAKVRFK